VSRDTRGTGMSLDNAAKLELTRQFARHTPHSHLQGIRVERVEGDEITLCLPYRDELVGNPETGVIHSGALTVLLDQTLGMAGLCSDLLPPTLTPTLDLRIDHLGVAAAGRDIYAVGRLYRATQRIIFVEGFAYSESRDRPVARATGNFVRMVTLAQVRDSFMGSKA
jgi:uncharacterized protein (TIGR00369 family)